MGPVWLVRGWDRLNTHPGNALMLRPYASCITFISEREKHQGLSEHILGCREYTGSPKATLICT